MARLAKAGFPRSFVERAILPDWWGSECERDPELVRDLCFRVARFLGVPIAAVEQSGALPVPRYPGARLRRVKNVDADQLGPSIHAGIEVARAVVRSARNLRELSLPGDANSWATDLKRGSSVIGLQAIAADLWSRGVPLVHVDRLPVPRFQAMACVVEQRPVVLVGHRFDVPARLALLAAHEFGHIVRGDCEEGVPVVDEDEETNDPSEMEQAAEAFAWTALGGGSQLPALNVTGDPRALAREALEHERGSPFDAGVLLWVYGNRTGDFGVAQRALKALYREHGGKRALREEFERWVDVEEASETDRALLDCVFWARERDESAD